MPTNLLLYSRSTINHAALLLLDALNSFTVANRSAPSHTRLSIASTDKLRTFDFVIKVIPGARLPSALFCLRIAYGSISCTCLSFGSFLRFDGLLLLSLAGFFLLLHSLSFFWCGSGRRSIRSDRPCRLQRTVFGFLRVLIIRLRRH